MPRGWGGRIGLFSSFFVASAAMKSSKQTHLNNYINNQWHPPPLDPPWIKKKAGFCLNAPINAEKSRLLSPARGKVVKRVFLSETHTWKSPLCDVMEQMICIQYWLCRGLCRPDDENDIVQNRTSLSWTYLHYNQTVFVATQPDYCCTKLSIIAVFLAAITCQTVKDIRNDLDVKTNQREECQKYNNR